MILAIAIGLVFGFFGSVPVAGPIAVLVLARAVERRYVTGVRIALGAAVGEGLYAGLAYWGVSELFDRFPLIAPISRGIAACILVALGTRLFIRPPVPQAADELRGSNSAFFLGLTITGLNPTLIATYTVVVAMVLSTGAVRLVAWHAIPFGLAAGVGTALWFTLLVALVRRYRDNFSPATLTRFIRWMGVVLVVIGIGFALSLLDPSLRPR